MAYTLSQRYPNTYLPRRNDLPDSRNQRPNQLNPTSTPTQIQATNGVQQPLLPTTMPQILPTPFTPLHNWNQHFLPAGHQIPTRYSHPTALTEPWPKGVNSVQQRTVTSPAPQMFPLPNQQVQQHTNFKPPVPVGPAVQNQVHVPTYAQVANPWYNFTYLQNQQPLNLPPNEKNQHYSRNARKTIPVR